MMPMHRIRVEVDRIATGHRVELRVRKTNNKDGSAGRLHAMSQRYFSSGMSTAHKDAVKQG